MVRIQNWALSLTDSVVTALIDGWADPSLLTAYHDNLCNFESGVVAQPKLLEFSLFVEFVDGLERRFKRYASIWSMEVKDIDIVCLELLQGLL